MASNIHIGTSSDMNILKKEGSHKSMSSTGNTSN